MRVIGIDVSKASVTACVTDTRPAEPRQFYFDAKFLTLPANAAGIRALIDLGADVAVLEPTGVNYSKLWGTQLARAGVRVVLVGHKELRGYRAGHLGLPDKDDDADSLALACYYWDYCDSPRRFVSDRTEAIVQIRRLVLRLCHLNRVQSPIINRLRQDLAWQFPEVAHVKSKRVLLSDLPPLLWSWMAGLRPSAKYDRLYAATCGLGLDELSRNHAARLCNLHAEECAIERQLYQFLQSPDFAPYRKVFARFGFGLRVEALLISQIYPIENYLGPDGKPEIKIRKGRKSGNPTKRHLSLRRFTKALGCAPGREESGDMKRVQVVGGSDLCRRALWQWIFTRIEPEKARPKNQIGKLLGDRLDQEKSTKPIRLARSRCAGYAARLLFCELVSALIT